jgi:hypothetical protein
MEEFIAALKFCDLNMPTINLEFIQLVSFEVSSSVEEVNHIIVSSDKLR